MDKILFQDIQAAYVNRYQFFPVPGTTDQFDVLPIRGAVTVQGTPVRAQELNQLQENVDEAKLDKSAVADFVVEQGTSGSWTYRKWKSGTAECWGITAQDLSGSNPFGSCYIKIGGELSLPAGLFTGRPIPTVSCYGPDYCHVTVNNVTQSMISLYYITLQNSTRSTDAFMHLIGRWK